MTDPRKCVALILGDKQLFEITVDEAFKFLEARYVKEGGNVRYDMVTNQVLKKEMLMNDVAIERPINQTHYFVTHAVQGIMVLVVFDQVTYAQREMVGTPAVRWSKAKACFDQFRAAKQALNQEV